MKRCVVVWALQMPPTPPIRAVSTGGGANDMFISRVFQVNLSFWSGAEAMKARKGSSPLIQPHRFNVILLFLDLGIWGCTCKLQVPASLQCEVMVQEDWMWSKITKKGSYCCHADLEGPQSMGFGF